MIADVKTLNPSYDDAIARKKGFQLNIVKTYIVSNAANNKYIHT